MSVLLVLRKRVKCQGMDRTGKLVRKNRVDDAMAVDSRFAFELLRHNINTEVGFSSRLVTGMTDMLMRLIDHFQMQWGKCEFEFRFDCVFYSHEQ